MTKWAISDHDLIQKDVAQILRFYGFTAQEEAPARIPEGGYGRIDVVGRKGNITIGVEIVDSRDVARDAKKLVMKHTSTLSFFALQNTWIRFWLMEKL